MIRLDNYDALTKIGGGSRVGDGLTPVMEILRGQFGRESSAKIPH